MSPPRAAGFRPHETARYTYELVASLRKIALQQKQDLLAHLLHLAAVEAEIQSFHGDHDTSLPG